MLGHGWKCSSPVKFEYSLILRISLNGLTSDFHFSHVNVLSIAGIFFPLFLHSLFSLYSFFSLNTGVPLLPCTGFFHDVFDNFLWNEIIVRVTGTKFFSKSWYRYFNVRPLSSVKNIFWQSKFDMSIETFLTKYVSWVALKSQHDVVEIVFGL